MALISVSEFTIEPIISEAPDALLNYAIVKDGKVEKICPDLNAVFDELFGISRKLGEQAMRRTNINRAKLKVTFSIRH